MKKFSLSLVFFSLVLSSVTSAYANGQRHPEKLKVIRISAIENEVTHELAKAVVRAAYQKLGIEIEFYDLPARRALEWANAGKTDGDVARIDGTEYKFTNLIKISIPVNEFKGVAFTKDINRKIQSWEDLKGLSVGIIGGYRYADLGTKGLDRVLAKDNAQLFKLLNVGHIDIAISGLYSGKLIVAKRFKDSKIQTIGDPLHSSFLYHFIHKKHKDLAPRLESTLLEMKNSGEIERIREKTLQEIFSK